jgi:hypothetical protein
VRPVHIREIMEPIMKKLARSELERFESQIDMEHFDAALSARIDALRSLLDD